MPNSWIEEHLGAGYGLTGSSNKDGDPRPDREEYFAGLDPDAGDELLIQECAASRLGLRKIGAQMCHYVLETSTNFDASARRWVWAEHSTVSSTNGQVVLPAFGASNLMMRVRVRVPAE